MYNNAYAELHITKAAYETIAAIEKELSDAFSAIEENESINEAKVLAAFHKNKVAAHYFNPTTGYGYDDLGRDNLDKVFADIFGTEAAVVSPQIVSGTHAIFAVLNGILRNGDCMLSLSGRPYDTLVDAIGINSNPECSLREKGVSYEQIDLKPNGSFDSDEIAKKVSELKPRVAYVQRSR